MKRFILIFALASGALTANAQNESSVTIEWRRDSTYFVLRDTLSGCDLKVLAKQKDDFYPVQIRSVVYDCKDDSFFIIGTEPGGKTTRVLQYRKPDEILCPEGYEIGKKP
jgi:hypothetical protein